VLFIYNDPTAPEALLGEVFTEFGFDVETFDVVPTGQIDDPVGEVSFPDPLRYDVIVPLGSRWSVYDERLRSSWVGTEMKLVRDADAAGIGVLGVCFGGQLVAQALGGTVGPSPYPEIGWYRIDSDATDFIASGPWFQWHSDRWTTPAGATEIARNANAPQAFALGNTVALQFHPELDSALLELWIENDSTDDLGRLGIDADTLRAATAAQTDTAPDRLRSLVAGFLERLNR
jgi:GMP synthase-like glutamine amidotransferase